MIVSMQLTEKTITPRCKIQEGSQARLKNICKLTEQEMAKTKGEWVYIVWKTQSSVRAYS